MFTYLHIDCLSLRSFKAMSTNIAKIEKECYPKYMRSLQSIDSRNDLKEYCESEDVFAIYNDTTYVLCTEDEVVDFASISKLSLIELMEVKKLLKDVFSNRAFFLDARETTSYRLIKFLEKRKEIVIISDEAWNWGTDVFHSLNVYFN